MTTTPSIVPVADHAVLVKFGGEISGTTLARINALAGALTRHPPAGLTELVPAMTSLLVDFDPIVTDHEMIRAAVLDNLATPGEVVSGRTHVIDVCYDEAFAPDLRVLADLTGLDTAAVVTAHLEGTYTVGMYGFAPGYAYLYGTPEAIQQPRKSTPGAVVAAGSVIVAGQQCLIIPTAMSTGWFAIGRSPAQMYSTDQDQPFLLDLGDTVSFRRIGSEDLVSRLAELGASAQ